MFVRLYKFIWNIIGFFGHYLYLNLTWIRLLNSARIYMFHKNEKWKAGLLCTTTMTNNIISVDLFFLMMLPHYLLNPF